jgi:hypothetical protein
MARRKASNKTKNSGEVTKILSHLIKVNGFVGEGDLLQSVFSGETQSIKPTNLNISVWGYIHKSAIVHRSTKFGSSRITDCFLKDMDSFIPESSD